MRREEGAPCLDVLIMHASQRRNARPQDGLEEGKSRCASSARPASRRTTESPPSVSSFAANFRQRRTYHDRVIDHHEAAPILVESEANSKDLARSSRTVVPPVRIDYAERMSNGHPCLPRACSLV